MSRHFGPLDQLLIGLDEVLKGTTVRVGEAQARATPSAAQSEDLERPADRRHAAGLMRVNHAGEIAAQALYRGQALTARTPEIRAHMLAAAVEEEDHLRWCEQRLSELDAGPSALAPLWFGGAYVMGAAAGLAGDAWSLGFVAETEHQVSEHLQTHLELLPEQDARSRAIVGAMQADEQRHGEDALAAGGRRLPRGIREAMRRVARTMTRTAYWI